MNGGWVLSRVVDDEWGRFCCRWAVEIVLLPSVSFPPAPHIVRPVLFFTLNKTPWTPWMTHWLFLAHCFGEAPLTYHPNGGRSSPTLGTVHCRKGGPLFSSWSFNFCSLFVFFSFSFLFFFYVVSRARAFFFRLSHNYTRFLARYLRVWQSGEKSHR